MCCVYRIYVSLCLYDVCIVLYRYFLFFSDIYFGVRRMVEIS